MNILQLCNMDAQTTFQTLIDFLTKNDRDPLIDNKVEIAEWNTSMLTGENQKKYLDALRSKEDKAQKEQRAKVTISRTPIPANKVMRIYDGVEQANNYFEDFKIMDSEESSRESLAVTNYLKTLERINKVGLKKFIFKTVKRCTFYDPNSYLILEQTGDGIENIKVLPCDSVLKTKEFQNELQYIIFLTNKVDYWIYSKSSFYQLRLLNDDEVATYSAEYQIVNIAEGANSGSYAVIAFNQQLDLPMCPAICVGYIQDPTKLVDFYHSPLNIAEKQFLDLIRDKSEYDLAKAIHGFLKKYAYVPKCNYKRRENGQTTKCDSGYLSHDDSECPACKGTGVSVHFSQQDIILFKINKLDEMQKIGDLTHYEKIPTEYFAANREDFMQWELDILEMVFNSDQFDKSKVITATATEKLLDQQGIHAKFVEYSNKVAQVIKFFTNLLADVYNVRNQINYTFGFSNDFHLESLDELIEMRKKSIEAGASTHIINLIDSKILMKMSQGDNELVRRIEARERFRPFKNHSLEDKAIIFQTIDLNSETYQRYLHFDDIMDKVEQYQIDLTANSEEGVVEFHELNNERQEELIKEVQEQFFTINIASDANNREGTE